MRVQQVPNSPYFIHYDDEGFCCISKSRESQESIPESEMQEFLAEQVEQIEEYDESLVRRMVEKVTVYEEKFSVEFKSGTRVDVKR